MKIKVIDYGYEKLPIRNHYNDAGADVYIHVKDRTKILRLPPNDTITIPWDLVWRYRMGMRLLFFQEVVSAGKELCVNSLRLIPDIREKFMPL